VWHFIFSCAGGRAPALPGGLSGGLKINLDFPGE